MSSNASRPQSDDEACGRLWEVYVQEAQQYDEGLVRSWKDDMDVTLVFSGLYSAVLTAFVIESYQKLQQDPTDVSVALLQQISYQLSSSTSQSFINATQPASMASFSPTPSAVACNVLWFMSLILALCCAFLATFVQQWSRQFLHKTGLLRSSTAHARLFSFLYFGLKEFGMHTVVNLIPSLLHLSLFLFLGGLVAFTYDVNTALAWLIVSAMCIIIITYCGFTILPVLVFNSPYQTPFSPLAWRIWQFFDRLVLPPFRNLWIHSKTNIFNAIAYAQAVAIHPVLPVVGYPQQLSATWQRPPFLKALIPSFFRNSYTPSMHHQVSKREKLRSLSDEIIVASQRDCAERDARSITWAVASLTDDVQLLPFVEALPETIYGPGGLRENNFYLIKPVLETSDPQLDIIARIHSLLVNAHNPWFDEKHRERCRTACSKALWVLAYLLMERPLYFDLSKTSRVSWFPRAVRDTLLAVIASAPQECPHAVSAFALCELDVAACIYGRLHVPGYAQSNLDAATQAFFDDEIGNQPDLSLPTSAANQTFSMQVETQAATRCHRAVSMFVRVAADELSFEGERTGQLIMKCLTRHNRLGAFIAMGPLGLNKLTRQLEIPNPDNSVKKKIPMFDSIVTIWSHLAYKRDEDIGSAIEYIGRRARSNGWTSTEKIWKASSRGSKALLTLLMNDDSIPINDHWCNAVREYIYIHTRAQSVGNAIYGADDLEDFWSTFALKLVDTRWVGSDNPTKTAFIAVFSMIAMRGITVDTYADTKSRRPSSTLVHLFEYLGRSESAIGESLKLLQSAPSLDKGVQASLLGCLSTQLISHFDSALGSTTAMEDIRDTLEFILYIVEKKTSLEGAVMNDDVALAMSKHTEDMCRWWKDTSSENVNWDILDILLIVWHLWGFFGVVRSLEAAQRLESAADLIRTGEAQQKIRRLQRSGRGSRLRPLPMDPMTFNPYNVDEIIKVVRSQVVTMLCELAP